MTERLSALLHLEASGLDVPPPAPAEMLTRGRGIRRRHRALLATGATAASVLAAAAAMVIVAVVGPDDHAIDPAKVADYRAWGAVAVGRDIYIGDQHLHWDSDIKAMYYTSAGVVVRGSTVALIRADGEVSPVDVDIPDRIPGFEPDSTRFAYVDALGGDRWEVVVHDAASDEELARVEVDGPAYGGWDAPPAAIDGDLVWVHLSNRWVEVDWRTGAVRNVPGTRDTYELANGAYAVQAGRYAKRDDGDWEIRSWADGSLIGTAALLPEWYAFFSPDGRFLRAFSQARDRSGPNQPRVYDVATGESRVVDDADEDFGWTPDGDLLVVHPESLSVCKPISGACETRPFDGGTGDLRIGGNPYES